MHRALCLEEILLRVFSYCHTPAIHWPWPLRTHGRDHWYANAHLAVLARTCKMFKEPALNLIWADLDDLTPLIRCLPEASWIKSDSIYSLHGPLEAHEWEIILGYARRIRALPNLRRSSGLAESCIETLSNPPASVASIFTNLRVVGLILPNAAFAPLQHHLINPQLTKIYLGDAENVDIQAFGEGCPLVTEFRVFLPEHGATISDLIRYWPNLSTVDCCLVTFTVDALSHLACSRNLLDVAFTVHDAVVDRLSALHPPLSPLTFSVLHHARLSSETLPAVSRLLLHSRYPEINYFAVSTSIVPDGSDLMSFFVALQEALIPHDSLNRLRLWSNDKRSSTVRPWEDVSPYLTFDRLRPLMLFVNIKSITIDIPCNADLNERELLRLASSWPRLEDFAVGESCDWAPSSGLSPGGFLQLLEKCRSLRVLYCVFDTRGYTQVPQGHPWRGLSMPNSDAFVHVLHSPIEEESIEALGVFFHVAPYPTFALITHWDNHRFRGNQRPRELYHERWVKVGLLARGLWEERMNLRRELRGASSRRQVHYSSGDVL